jgi:hypothetical protein
MPDLALLDNRNEDTVYLFNSETGDLIPREQAAGKPQVAGYGSRKKIGVLRLRVITVAVYCEGERLILWVDGKSANLSTDHVRGRVRLAAPFVREFRLTQGERVVYACTYWHSGARTWPDDGDIFSLVQRITASPDALARTHRIWTARLDGR